MLSGMFFLYIGLTKFIDKMPVKKKSWREKLYTGRKPKLVEVPKKWIKTLGRGKMLILTPELVYSYVKALPDGKLSTINNIRDGYAGIYKADFTCPVSTGIFMWICANCAEEEKAHGVKNVAPYWRVLKEGGKLNTKYPGGVKHHAALLEKDGFTVVKGKTEFSWMVKDFEKHLAAFKPV